MKLKGISPFEQHVEKIVLGAAVVGVVGIAAWQFISAPVVKLGSQTVPPGEVDALLQKKAEGLQVRLRGESNIVIPAEGVPLAAPTFGDRLRKPVSPVASLARTAPSFNGALVKANTTASDVWYHEPKFSPLTMLAVHETADALTADAAKAAAKASPILAARFGSVDGPADVVWTTPVARIDLKAVRAELARADKDATPPKQSIPGVWYQETPYIVDVQFERRVKDADGGWSAPVAVPVFTSHSEELTFRGRIEGANAELKDAVFSLLGVPEQQLEVLQLPFYETVNSAFVSPAVLSQETDPGVSAPARDPRALRLMMQAKTQLDQKQRRVTVLRAELVKLGGLWDEEEARKEADQRARDRRDSEKGSGSGGKGGGLTGGGPGGPGGSMSGKNNVNNSGEKDELRTRGERKRKTAELKRLESEIAALEKQVGVAPEVPGAAKSKAPNVATSDDMLVWGHDLEVEPGKTYQYRCVARVYNPFFGKGNQLIKQQADKGLASAFTLDTVTSAWSQETTISPSVRFFVTRAIVGDGSLQMGTAQVEVYRLLDGQWRRTEMTVQPGERIGRKDARAAETEVDFSTDYFVVDVIEDIDGKGSGTRGDRRPGFVVVRAMSSEGMEVRNPANDLDDPDRLKLRSQSDAAASAKPDVKAPAAGDSNAPRGAGGAGAPGAPAGPGGPSGGR